MKMAKRNSFKFTHRDQEILEAIERFPLTPDQLCKLSESFDQPFGDTHGVRRRLRKLVAAKLIVANPFAVASFGSSPAYYKLTRTGYRLLHGFDAELPPRRYFEAIGQARHPHTIALTDLLVHLFVDVSRQGFQVRHYARENSVCLETPLGKLRPDAAFQIVADGRAFNFVVELDNGTERVRSRLDVESIERKIRGYESHSRPMAAFDPSRYVVLFVTTRCGDRLKHLLTSANVLMKNRKRTLFLGASLPDLLSHDDVLGRAAFLTPSLEATTLLPSTKAKIRPQKTASNLMPPAPAFC